MSRFGRSLVAAAAGLFLATAPVKAAVHIYDIGVIGVGSVTFTGNTGTGSFVEYIKFQLGFSGPGSVSYSNTAQSGGAIVGGVLELDACLTNCTGTVSTPTGTFVNSAPLINLGPTVQVAGFGPDLLNAGSYFLQLSGAVPAGQPAIAYTGTITVAAAVPEPGTWAMMLIGFAGLAFASSRRRTSAVVTA
jgi:PEP-CTERM motif